MKRFLGRSILNTYAAPYPSDEADQSSLWLERQDLRKKLGRALLMEKHALVFISLLVPLKQD